ncbi:hypothetical protein AUJ84_03720 [Candidatus Pacearchaeota archaeon CG1_02_32_132]|nr:MAG: hypothetical protein AUJ84_03720 [Candidatus Pacearchaeota archaeon CG1_02_32_132]
MAANPQKKNWFQRHKILGTFLIIFVFLILAGMISNALSPKDSKVQSLNSNENINPPSPPNTYTIEILGTEGIEFSGNIGGGGNSRSIDGSVPSTYTVEGWPAVAVIQKKGASGILKVIMKKGDKILNEQETSAAYGVVTVSSG